MQKEIKNSFTSAWLGPHFDQASFALLVMDTFYQPCLRKRREPMTPLRETGRVGRKGVDEREVSTLLMPQVSLTRTLNEFPITGNIVAKDHRTRTRSAGCSACCAGLWGTPEAEERGFCAGKRKARCTRRALLYKVFLYLEVRPSSLGSERERADNANECAIKEQDCGHACSVLALLQESKGRRGCGGRGGHRWLLRLSNMKTVTTLRIPWGEVGKRARQASGTEGDTKQAPSLFEVLISSYSCFTTSLVLE